MSQISSPHPSTLRAGSLTLEVAHLLWETDGVWMWGGSAGTGGVSSVSSSPAGQCTDERSTEWRGPLRGGPCSVPGPASPPVTIQTPPALTSAPTEGCLFHYSRQQGSNHLIFLLILSPANSNTLISPAPSKTPPPQQPLNQVEQVGPGQSGKASCRRWA